MIPTSISALYYTWGNKFYGFMTLIGCIILLLAYLNESYLLAFAGVSAPAVASFGDFKGTDKYAHYLQAVFVFIPLLLYTGWIWVLYGLGAGVLGYFVSSKSIFWAEIGIILIALIGIL